MRSHPIPVQDNAIASSARPDYAIASSARPDYAIASSARPDNAIASSAIQYHGSAVSYQLIPDF
ncbi:MULTISPECIES: hypothetical protein [unclassified Moorena]|uniref:hypothetical protein n=1 Tax=unclassified Moorena TaxID=2683338 RepID=UPI0013C8140F|nr:MULTISPECIES: hypothetical protein [unclassified Moorena]NEO17976.1 hypothetical protein [Moorena sp. SIO4A5]NEQ56257.1 hypothetical protein [Moorena sp. SIO4A1]